jgi:hypothetical protein
MIARMTLMAGKKRRTFGSFAVALPLTLLLTASWSAGELIGYLTGRANRTGTPAAEAIARGTQATL